MGASEQAAWSNLVERYIDGKLNGTKPYTILNRTPAVLARLFGRNVPIRIEKHILDKITGEILTSSGRRHGIPASDLKDMLIELDNPIAVFRSRNEANTAVVLTRIVDRQNNERAVVVLKMDAKYKGIDISVVKSAYGKDNGVYQKWMDDGLLLYVNKRALESPNLPLQLRLILQGQSSARELLTEDDFTGEQLGLIVPDSNPGVNTNLSVGGGNLADTRMSISEKARKTRLDSYASPFWQAFENAPGTGGLNLPNRMLAATGVSQRGISPNEFLYKARKIFPELAIRRTNKGGGHRHIRGEVRLREE
ncbi:MAG: hypothetical protein SPK06_07565 [Kiritimatiellia bacterium]|nr:hypothetical protein [Kiritimatiellia bacterium]